MEMESDNESITSQCPPATATATNATKRAALAGKRKLVLATVIVMMKASALAKAGKHGIGHQPFARLHVGEASNPGLDMFDLAVCDSDIDMEIETIIGVYVYIDIYI